MSQIFPKAYFRSSHQGSAVQLLKSYLEECKKPSPLNAEELISLGSVYINGQRAQRDDQAKAQDLFKVHLFPKRYPIENLPFLPFLIFECEDFIVIDKPAPLPTHPTSDNRQENLLAYIQRHHEKKFYVTSRLDVHTEGLILFAKSKEAQTQINQLFHNGAVQKIYRSFSFTRPPLGAHTHYTSIKASPRRHFSTSPFKDCRVCQMKILKVLKAHDAYEAEIELITGRTHQIRGQMALLGCPIIGDSLYSEIKPTSDVCPNEKLMLECQSLEFTWKGQQFKFVRPLSKEV